MTSAASTAPDLMNLTREEARARAALLRVDSYAVELDVTGDGPTFTSRTTARFSLLDAASAGASTFIDLVAPRVVSATLNGEALDVSGFDGARLALPSLAAENELVVVADAAYMNTGEGLHRFVDPVDGETYLYSQFEVADTRRVFAVFEQPDLKATFAFTVTAPAHWTVISNSPTPEPTVEGEASTGVWRFAPTPVLACYVTAIVAGPYAGERGELTSSDGRTVPLGVFCRASLVEHLDAGEVMDITRAGFAFFEERFDRAYPFEKYDQVFVPEFNAGAMENAGAVTFVESYVFRSKPTGAMVERRATTILHELAHMWFGDLVTMRWWDDLWLNESFAEYASTLAQAEATRWTSAWTTFASLEKSWAYRQDQLPSTHPIVADMTDLEAVEVNFDGITYAKGASVLKQLVAWVGREHFEEGLRTYFRKHAWGNTTLDDFLTELEATSGRDLRSWSALWLEQAGVTTLRPVITTDEEGVMTSVVLGQEVPADHPVQRPHRLVVGLYDVHVEDVPAAEGGGTRSVLRRTRRVELDVTAESPESTPIAELTGVPRPDLLLVNDEDLAYAKVRLDDVSLATAITHLGDFEESLPRSLVWGATWDMTRDAEMAARDFLDLVLTNVAAETDSSVVLTVLRQLTTTLTMYTAPELRESTAADVGDRLLALAESAPAGSDGQLQLTKLAAARATTPAQLDAVAALFAGSATREGLEIDTDLRWELLLALVAGGRAGEGEIAAELQRDDTATGRRAAAAARAAVPTAEAKAAAWSSIVEPAAGEELPNAVQAAVIGGFHRVVGASGDALLEPYVEPYFSTIEGVWRSRTNEIAQQVVSGFSPVQLATPALLERYDAWLASAPADLPALVRLVSEDRDALARALRAQERDRQR